MCLFLVSGIVYRNYKCGYLVKSLILDRRYDIKLFMLPHRIYYIYFCHIIIIFYHVPNNHKSNRPQERSMVKQYIRIESLDEKERISKSVPYYGHQIELSLSLVPFQIKFPIQNQISTRTWKGGRSNPLIN